MAIKCSVSQWKKGFTLIELLVSIAIMSLVSIMLFSVMNPVSRIRAQLRTEIIHIVDMFQMARNNARSGMLLYTDSDEEVVPGGYGVFVDTESRSVTLFGDTDTLISEGEKRGNGLFDPLEDIIIDRFSITLEGVNLGGSVSYTTLTGDVVSVPLDATTPSFTLLMDAVKGQTIIVDSNYQSNNQLYSSFEIIISRENILTEKIIFSHVSGFFERVQTYPSLAL